MGSWLLRTLKFLTLGSTLLLNETGLEAGPLDGLKALVDRCAKRAEPNSINIPAGGSLIKYEGGYYKILEREKNSIKVLLENVYQPSGKILKSLRVSDFSYASVFKKIDSAVVKIKAYGEVELSEHSFVILSPNFIPHISEGIIPNWPYNGYLSPFHLKYFPSMIQSLYKNPSDGFLYAELRTVTDRATYTHVLRVEQLMVQIPVEQRKNFSISGGFGNPIAVSADGSFLAESVDEKTGRVRFAFRSQDNDESTKALLLRRLLLKSNDYRTTIGGEDFEVGGALSRFTTSLDTKMNESKKMEGFLLQVFERGDGTFEFIVFGKLPWHSNEFGITSYLWTKGSKNLKPHIYSWDSEDISRMPEKVRSLDSILREQKDIPPEVYSFVESLQPHHFDISRIVRSE